jgi:hypothetical protein
LSHMFHPSYHLNRLHLKKNRNLLIQFCFSMKNISFARLLISSCLEVIQQ